MSNYLVITAVGNDRPGIVNDLTNAITESGCNIENSRMTILGGEFALIMLISGNWNTIAKLEDTLPRLEEQLKLNIFTKRTGSRAKQANLLSYHVEALAMDQPGIVHRVADFFARRNINIENLNTDSYHAAHTGTPMFSLAMTINIPSGQPISTLREQFLDFCDEMNLDGLMEPCRN